MKILFREIRPDQLGHVLVFVVSLRQTGQHDCWGRGTATTGRLEDKAFEAQRLFVDVDSTLLEGIF